MGYLQNGWFIRENPIQKWMVYKGKIPLKWMAFVRENPIQKWMMITRGYQKKQPLVTTGDLPVKSTNDLRPEMIHADDRATHPAGWTSPGGVKTDCHGSTGC